MLLYTECYSRAADTNLEHKIEHQGEMCLIFSDEGSTNVFAH